MGVSNIIRNLIMFIPPYLMALFDRDLHKSFLEQIARITCFFAEGSAHEESVICFFFFFLSNIINIHILPDTFCFIGK